MEPPPPDIKISHILPFFADQEERKHIEDPSCECRPCEVDEIPGRLIYCHHYWDMEHFDDED